LIRLLIHGSGRMARRVLALAQEDPGFEIVGLVSRSQPDDLGGFPWRASLEDVVEPADLLIDFTLPGGTRAAAAWAGSHSVPFLSGTTGLKETETRVLEEAARQAPVLAAPNLSQGVALMTSLVRHAAGVLGTQADITITDIHHEHKVDAPSGTALALAAAVMEGRSEELQQLLEPGRLDALLDGGGGQLAFTSVREGEVIGEHTVAFSLGGEVVEVTHKALDRDIFAAGALRAGAWLVGQPPGFYTTADWLA